MPQHRLGRGGIHIIGIDADLRSTSTRSRNSLGTRPPGRFERQHPEMAWRMEAGARGREGAECVPSRALCTKADRTLGTVGRLSSGEARAEATRRALQEAQE